MIYRTIVGRYLEYLHETYRETDLFNTDKGQMSELLRYSLCVALGVSSKPATTRVDLESKKCSAHITQGIDSKGWSTEYKLGVIEACLKCLALAQDKGGK